MSNVLLAGPWVGEFGWELFCWQGFIRKKSKNYDKTIVIGRPGHKFLYEDFCDEYIEFDPEGFKTDSWRCSDCKTAYSIVKNTEHTDYIDGNFDIGFRYTDNHFMDFKGLFKNEQEFVKYDSKTSELGFDVILHCRNKSTGSDRNWDLNKWIELYKLLPKDLKVACIGNSEAYHVEGTYDLRNTPLLDLVSIMNNSKIIVGPSSGPMHLASLCGLKHLVWSTDHNRLRYTKIWNPFNTDVVFYSDENWNPSPKNIKRIIIEEIYG